MSELPQNWHRTKFTDVFDVQGGTQPPKSTFLNDPTEGYVRLLQIRDFGTKPVPTYIPITKSIKTCEKDDLLIARYGASLGRICTGMSGAYNVALAKLICPEEISKAFAKYYLCSEQFQAPLLLLSRSAQNGFNKEDLSDFDFSFPPKAEQIRIAQKLDELLAQVDTLNVRINLIPSLLNRFRQSVLASATSGCLTKEWRTRLNHNEITTDQKWEDEKLPSGWKVRPLETLVTTIEQGWSPKCESVPADGEEWAVIKTTAIQPISFVPTENKRLPTTLLPKPELTVVSGDILITRAGPRNRAGICCYVKETKSKLMVCDKAYRFRAIEGELLGPLLCYFLNSPQFVSALDNLKTGISDSGVNLTMRKLKDLPLPQPPTEEQTEIVRQVEQLFAFADQLEAKVASAKSRIDHLTQSILTKAFRGELVPQDPNDEPASVLLERIKAQRAAAPKAKRGGKVSA